MTDGPGSIPRTVVIDPGLLVHEILPPHARTVCTAWRDGRIVPAFTRRTLDHALRLLRDMGLHRDAVEIWAMWFTSKDKAIVVSSAVPDAPILQEYAHAVVEAHALGFVTHRPEDFAGKLPSEIAVLTPDSLISLLSTLDAQ